ncbi:MAG: endonuclease III [Candidatus Peribacteraceae bacterium]|nr:endonuclease III [Candidatus Peribacteraceae bacterium]
MKQSISIPYVLRKLEELYDPPRSFLDWETPLDLTVATILSAQCTDARVNSVTKALFRRCRTPQDYLALTRGELEKLVHSCGTFRNKARFIQELCALLLERHGGRVPATMKELTALPGIGRKTAAIILYAAFGKQEGIAVDTHVMRLARRLGLTKQQYPDKIALELEQQTPRSKWGRLNTLMISHGRAICAARRPKCEQCVFKKCCPSSRVRA